MQKSITLQQKIISSKSILCILSIAFSVALPQVFHLIGAITPFGSSFAAAFLPMHLPILIFAFAFGSNVGVISGALSVIISYFLIAMPAASILPFMILELATYGLIAGLIKDKNLPFMLKLIIVMLTGRLVRVGATIFAINVLGFETAAISLYSLVTSSIAGIVLQLILVPIIVKKVNKIKNNYEA